MAVSTIDPNGLNIGQIGGTRNKVINGGMVIDQRNGGASVDTSNTSGNVYTLDRWFYRVLAASKFTIQRNAGSVTPPAGFTNYLGCTSTTSHSGTAADLFTVVQAIEGFNVADLAWGTANASPVTLSFWVRSSLTGAFGGAIRNADGNRSYPFSFSISSANTWEKKTIVIAGDTSGTWGTSNNLGIDLRFDLGSGSDYAQAAGAWFGGSATTATGATSVVATNGATFYITGVQLEAGDTATPFEHRSYGQELALCQRYFYKIAAAGASAYLCDGFSTSSTQAVALVDFPVTMRSAPTVSRANIATNTQLRHTGGTNNLDTDTGIAGVPTIQGASVFITTSGIAVGSGFLRAAGSTEISFSFDSEL